MAEFIAGIFLGGFLGVAVMAILNMAGKCEEYYFDHRELEEAEQALKEREV